MGLALYRRHSRECKSGHSEEFRTSEYDERKKGWKRCDCPIFVSGTLSRKFARQSTGQWEWKAARAIAAKLEVSGRWTDEPVPEPSMPRRLQNAYPLAMQSRRSWQNVKAEISSRRPSLNTRLSQTSLASTSTASVTSISIR